MIENKKRSRAGKGFALLMVMMLMVMAVVLGMSYLSIAAVKTQSSSNFVSCAQARYLAESGLEHAMYILQTDPDALTASSEAHPLGPYSIDGGSEQYVLYATNDSPGHFILTAKGTTGSISQKASATAIRSGGPEINVSKAMLATSLLVKLPSTLTVNGDFHVNGKLINYARINGDVSATLGVTDTLHLIDRILNPQTQDLPSLTNSDYKKYDLFGQTFDAATPKKMAVFEANDPLANGGAITSDNPGGVVSLKPDHGQTTLPDNFKFQGTLVTSGDLVLDGANIELTAVDGFPAIVCSGNIVITPRTRVTINGVVLVRGWGGIVADSGGAAGAETTINGGIAGQTFGYDYYLGGKSHVLNYDADRCALYDVANPNSKPVAVHFEHWIR